MKFLKIVVFLAMTQFNLSTNLFSFDTYNLLFWTLGKQKKLILSCYQSIRESFQHKTPGFYDYNIWRRIPREGPLKRFATARQSSFNRHASWNRHRNTWKSQISFTHRCYLQIYFFPWPSTTDCNDWAVQLLAVYLQARVKVLSLQVCLSTWALYDVVN